MGNSSLTYLNFLNGLWPIILGGACLTSIGFFVMLYFFSSDDKSKLAQLKKRTLRTITTTILLAVFIGGSGAMVSHFQTGVGDHLKEYSKDSSWSINEGSLNTSGTITKKGIDTKKAEEQEAVTNATAADATGSSNDYYNNLASQGKIVRDFFSNIGTNLSNAFGNIRNMLSGSEIASSVDDERKSMNYSTRDFLDKVYNNQEVFQGK